MVYGRVTDNGSTCEGNCEMKRFPFFLALFCSISSSFAVAQSGAQYKAWQDWCIGQGGTPNGDASNPVCTPGTSNTGGGGYVAPQEPVYAGPSQYELEQQTREREEAAARARHTEEQRRRVEEEAEKQAQYLKERDAATATLKGISSEGTPKMKGIGDVSAPAIRELSSSDPSLLQTDDPCPPSQSGDVVDLCFLADGPAFLDFAKIKGLTPVEKEASAKDARRLAEDLSVFDREFNEYFTEFAGPGIKKVVIERIEGVNPNYTEREMQEAFEEFTAPEIRKMAIQAITQDLTKDANTKETPSLWPGPRNPEDRLINPLNDPEKYTEFLKKLEAGADRRAESAAKMAAGKKDWRTGYDRMSADPQFDKAAKTLIENLELAERKVHSNEVSDYMQRMENIDPHWYKYIMSDKLLAAKASKESASVIKSSDKKTALLRARAMEEMTILVKAWYDRNEK
jgi:hypothetical protein